MSGCPRNPGAPARKKMMHDSQKRFKLTTSESKIHDHINTVNAALKREVDFEIVLNVNNTTSSIEFVALESEAQMLKDRVDGTLLVENFGGWIPVL
jgi:hypothetical protein